MKYSVKVDTSPMDSLEKEVNKLIDEAVSDIMKDVAGEMNLNCKQHPKWKQDTYTATRSFKEEYKEEKGSRRSVFTAMVTSDTRKVAVKRKKRGKQETPEQLSNRKNSKNRVQYMNMPFGSEYGNLQGAEQYKKDGVYQQGFFYPKWSIMVPVMLQFKHIAKNRIDKAVSRVLRKL